MGQLSQVALRVDRNGGDLQFCHRHASDIRSGEPTAPHVPTKTEIKVQYQRIHDI